MKKRFIFGVLLVVLFAITSCEALLVGAAQGYQQGSSGYTIVGSASSENECKQLCIQKGYKEAYNWYASTGNCFCK